MVIPASYYVLLITLSLAAGCSLVKFRQHPAQLKLFAALLVVDLINELMASLVFPFLRSKFHLQNNMIIYNSFVLLQFMVYAAWFFMVIRFKWFKVICNAFLISFPALWIYTFWNVFGMYGWNSYVHVAGSAFTVTACAVFFYQVYSKEALVSLSKNTEFWIVAALFVYYTCNLPYTGMLNYLINNAMKAAVDLGVLLRLLNIVMYSIIIYAFLCREIRTTKSLLM